MPDAIPNDTDRIVSPVQQTGESSFDVTLRPSTLTEYIGQKQIKDNLAVFLEAARQRNETIDHVLLHGGPGLGKTTLAHIIAKEMNVNLRITSGAAIERAGDLAAILTNLGEGDILFIDEIHRLPRAIEEVLYPAMEDYALDMVIGKGPSARTLRLDLPKFTIVGATTRVSELSSPLRDRFGAQLKFDFYTPEEMAQIVNRSSQLLRLTLEPAAVMVIANRSRHTPRIANRLLKRVRDYSQVKGDGINVTVAHAEAALELLNIDALGLDQVDRKLLKTLIETFRGGPVGIQTLGATIGEDIDSLETVYEPFLLQLGFLARTPRGRIATAAAYSHLDYPVPTDLQAKLV